MKTVAFVPIKMNSERLPLKNIKTFHNGRPLVTYILETLRNVKLIDEIYVYCSSEDIKKYLPEKVHFLKRDAYYDLSTTPFNDVLFSFCEQIESDYYLLTHATAPFLKSSTIDKAIKQVINGEYDSALSVLKLQEFLWKDGKPINYSLDNIPRTQDLEPYYKETCGMYIFSRELMLKEKKRIGKKPFLVDVSLVESVDINTYEDFIIADAISDYFDAIK